MFSIAFNKNAMKIEIKNAAKITIMQSLLLLGPTFFSGISAGFEILRIILLRFYFCVGQFHIRFSLKIKLLNRIQF